MSSTLISLPRSMAHVDPDRCRPCRVNRKPKLSVPAQSSADWIGVAAFERFMNCLGPDEEMAGQKYESIRGGLILMFKARRCVFAEDLADATIERVARKLDDLTIKFTGDPAPYFYGVAKKVYLEYQRKIVNDHRRLTFSLPNEPHDLDLENKLNQLDEALSTIPKSDCELILRYYSGTGKNKIKYRRELAEQMGIGLNTLRLRVFRIRKEIKNFMLGSSPVCHGPLRLSA